MTELRPNSVFMSLVSAKFTSLTAALWYVNVQTSYCQRLSNITLRLGLHIVTKYRS